MMLVFCVKLFWITLLFQSTFVLLRENTNKKVKVAIIGGGIGGATAAYNVHQLFKDEADIDVFESNKVGGRIQYTEIGKREYEVGASILHKSNYYMVKYAKKLGLKAREDASMSFSIFDGERMRFSSSSWQFLTLSKMLWQYGFDIYRLNSLVTKYVEEFSRIYKHQESGLAFTSVSNLLASMTPSFNKMHTITTRKLLKAEGLSEAFIDDFVAAGIMVNYGQTPDVHAFVGFVSMAGTLPGLWSIHGGNNQVSEGLLELSKANVLPAEVISITKNTSAPNTTYDLQYMFTTNDNTEPIFVTQNYDIVFIATPLHEGKTDILFDEFDPPVRYMSGDYHQTVATMVQGLPNNRFFSYGSNDIDVILMNNPDLVYNSFARNLPVDWNTEEGIRLPLPVYKIFSKRVLDDKLLKKLFLLINEIKKFDWLAYPHYKTPTELPQFILDKNLYYLNGIEWAASAMEMSCIAGRNVALLAFNNWKGLHNKIDSFKDSTSDKKNQKLEL